MDEEPKVAIRLDADALEAAGGRRNEREVLRWLLGYLGRHKALTVGVYALVLASAAAGFAVWPFTKLVMDAVQGLGSTQERFDALLAPSTLGRIFLGYAPLTVLGTGALLLIGAKLLQALLGATSQALNDALTGRIGRDMRADLFRHVLELPEDYLAEHPVGEVSARFVQNVNAAVGIYTAVFFMPLISVLTLLFSVVYVLVLDWRLGLVALGFAPVYHLLVGRFGKPIESRTKAVSEQFAAVNQDLQETLSAAREIKAHGSEARERVEFGGNIERQYRATLTLSRWQLIAGQSTKFLTEAAPTAILVAGAFLIVRGSDISFGDLIVFYGFVPTLLGAMNTMSGVRLGYVSSITFATEIWELLREVREPEMLSGPEELTIPDELDPSVPILEFDHVYMTYPRSGYRVSDMSFKVYPGQTVAIVGEGGSGKSTVFNILFKLYDYERGSVKLFGRELRTLSIASTRRAVGLMTQFPYFFQRSFRENVCYGVDERDEAVDRRMKQICAELEMDSVVASMPQGYETTIVNRGANLSGSQQKRTALARVLMREPQVLLLDEPLSGLSPDQRREVSGRIRRLAKEKGKTVFTITHDLELIEDMDHILVFKRVERPEEEPELVHGVTLAVASAAGSAVAAKAAMAGTGSPAKGAVAPAKGAMPAKGEPMPAKGEPMPAKGEPMPAKGEPMPAKGAMPTKGGPMPAKVERPAEQLQHGIIAEQGSWTELSRTGTVFRTLTAREAPPA